MVDDNPLTPSLKVAKELGITADTLANWRCKGRGPRYIKVGRAVFYRESAIRDWLKAQERDPAAKLA